RMSLSVKDQTIDKIMEFALLNQDLTYEIKDKVILIYKSRSEGLRGLQQQQITGIVTDATSGEPIAGANVTVEGTTLGSITNGEGKYSIEVPHQQSVLVISFIGYLTEKVVVGNKASIDVKLLPDIKKLDEVVVVGYGTLKKKYLVGAVAQIGSKELLEAPMPNVSNMITGKLAGVTSIQRSGMPGNDQTSINIRGLSTFTNSSPLILVDGVERMLNTVNPSDVENISILKDGASSAIYGVKGGNGVILITTKRGKEGKAIISYDESTTLSFNTAFPKFLNGPDYIYWYNKASEMDGLGMAFDADIQTKVIKGDPDGIYGNTNWLDLLFKDYGFTQQHNISATGGSEKTKYYVGAGLMDQDGIIDKVNYKRYNIRSNIDAKIADDFKLSLDLSAFYENRKWPGIGLSPQVFMNPIEQAVYAIPIIKPTYEDEYMGWTENGTTIYSPIASIKKGGFQLMQRFKFEGSGKLEYDFSRINMLKGLKAGIFLSYDYSNTADRNFLDSYEIMTYNKATKDLSLRRASGTIEGGSYDKSMSLDYFLMIRPSVEYNRLFGKHQVSALLLFEDQKYNASTMTGRKSGFLFSDPIDITLGQSYPSGVDPVTGSMSHTAAQSYVGRMGYGFAGKYLAEFSFRYDGTYIFAPENRWGFFPSVALGWVVSEEEFFKRLNVNSINYLKIRASYGESGSNDVDPYLWLSSYSMTTSPSYVFGGAAYPAVYTNNSIVSDLTWSRARSYNVGLDMTLWNGLLGFEFDYFYKVTSDILETQGGDMPPSLGGNYSTAANSGKMDNRGFELLLKHNNKINNDWSYSLIGNLSWARNKVLSRHIGNGVPWSQNELGRSLGIMYGLEAIGLYQTQDQIDNSPAAPSGTKSMGDLIYKDVNGDGRIDWNDYVKIGRGMTPELNFSLTMNASYKNLYLNALWQGVALCDYQLSAAYNTGVMDNTAFTRPFYSNGNAPYYLVEDSWTPDNTNAKYPRLSTIANGNNAWSSSWWVVNGTYLRLKNLQIGYSIPSSILQRTGINRISVYLAGTNLWTLSHFKYIDPEMPGVNNGYYPQQKTYSLGFNIVF
ncbi:MAG TPA: TonB-dependent receptor, partial [Bacteroidales bacterium]|nr:TonB-dependent receptor [Bacteroidales bacterium]